MVMSRRKIAKEIVEVIREKKDITKSKLIQEVSKRQSVGSSTVRDLLSQLCVLGVVGYKVIQTAQVHYVNEEKVGELKKIEG